VDFWTASRVVAVDLDGTLLRTDKTVSRRTVAALAATIAAGVRVVIVTGRPPRFVRAVAAEAGLTGPAVCSNGAIVYDPVSDAMDIVRPLPILLAAQVARSVAEVMPGAAFAIETGRHALVGPGYRHVAARDTDRAYLEDLWSTSEVCVKLLAWSPAAVTDEMVAAVQAGAPGVVVSYSGAAGMIEISAPGVTKSVTLARLCEGWGIAAREVIAFGDMPNDLDVLRWAGTSVAVANAHADVLASADRVTAGHDEDGVAMVLEELFVVPGR
jgi:Cof subfamily protein (haloacid dehalogenase superfamily)